MPNSGRVESVGVTRYQWPRTIDQDRPERRRAEQQANERGRGTPGACMHQRGRHRVPAPRTPPLRRQRRRPRRARAQTIPAYTSCKTTKPTIATVSGPRQTDEASASGKANRTHSAISANNQRPMALSTTKPRLTSCCQSAHSKTMCPPTASSRKTKKTVGGSASRDPFRNVGVG